MSDMHKAQVKARGERQDDAQGTWYLGITTTRKIIPARGEPKVRGEFAVLAQMEAKGIEAFVPRRIDFVRQGKRRYPDPVASPYLPGYVFFRADPHQFFDALTVRGMARTVTALRKGDLYGERRASEEVDGKARASAKRVQTGLGILDFRTWAEGKEAEAQRIVERNDRAAMIQFEPGDPVEIIAGPFFEFVARFKRMVDRAQDAQPMIEGEMEIFGRTTTVQIDPLHVRKA